MSEAETYDIPALKARFLELLGEHADVYPANIEQRFPRILHKIVTLWGKPELEAVFDELMVSTRPGRQGFPSEVAMELFRLSTLYGKLGLVAKRQQGTGWAGVDDAELFKREFTKGGR
jgi:hypothetical protein